MDGLTGTVFGDVAPLRSMVPTTRVDTTNSVGSFLQPTRITANSAVISNVLRITLFLFIEWFIKCET
jgi:hypothetical protein